MITGSKQWITNGPYADYAMIFAITDQDLFAARKGGITGFFVDTSWPGFKVVSTIPIMGNLGAEIGILSFDGLRVADSHRLGGLHQGLKVALRGVNNGRLGLSATCIGMAPGALDQAPEYAKVRRTFGQPIGEHQAVQILLADSASDIYSAETMLVDCALKLERGEKALAETSMVKQHCTDAANRVFDRCMRCMAAWVSPTSCGWRQNRFTRSMRIRMAPARSAPHRRARIAGERVNF